jgi:hypothetical protein
MGVPHAGMKGVGIILIVEPEAAAPLHDRDMRHPLMVAIRAAGAELYELPAIAADEPGSRTFTVEANAPYALADRLRRLPGVEACFVNSEEELVNSKY